jgi:hypothetical protein
LLGLCSEAERDHLESEYFEDEDSFQAMLTAEDDLIDAYARGKLTTEERRKFETHFLTSLRARDRVKFARVFAGVVSDPRSLESTPSSTWLDIAKSFLGSRDALRIATITASIVLVVVLSWGVSERRRMSKERRDEPTELSSQNDASRLSEDAERMRTAEATAELEKLQANSDRLKSGITTIQRANRVRIPKEKNSLEKISGRGHERAADQHLDRVEASPRNMFEVGKSGLLEASNVASLRTLIPRIATASPTLPLYPKSRGENTLFVSSSTNSIRLRLDLATAVQYEEFQAAIETINGNLVTTVHWTDSLRPNRHTLITPDVSTVDLPSGDYSLLLTAKEPYGSFVRVAEYLFSVVRH